MILTPKHISEASNQQLNYEIPQEFRVNNLNLEIAKAKTKNSQLRPRQAKWLGPSGWSVCSIANGMLFYQEEPQSEIGLGCNQDLIL